MTARSEASADPDLAEDLAAARRVLTLECDALSALAQSLNGDFGRAVSLLHATRGKLVVSGMGKSGHIANKIAATFASTGTPAHSIHPGEASHGDLGMIAPSDALLLLSNSGETPELRDMVAYSKLLQVPLLAITSRRGSSLCEAADVALLLPHVAEACPLGLAPTTSTTMMLALGDALAVALMQRRGFSSDQFQVLHPGGRLGRRFVKVEDIMHVGRELPLVAPDCPISEALLVMTEKTANGYVFGCVGVIDAAGRLIGIITDGDLRRHMADDLLHRRAHEVMTSGPKTIRPKALAAEALGQMNLYKINSLFVTDQDRPCGFLNMHDILRAGIA